MDLPIRATCRHFPIISTCNTLDSTQIHGHILLQGMLSVKVC
jgi:hypothetical protein